MLGISTDIITILTNFFLYWYTHPDFQKSVYNMIGQVTNGLYDDMTQPELPWPPKWDMNISE